MLCSKMDSGNIFPIDVEDEEVPGEYAKVDLLSFRLGPFTELGDLSGVYMTLYVCDIFRSASFLGQEWSKS